MNSSFKSDIFRSSFEKIPKIPVLELGPRS